MTSGAYYNEIDPYAAAWLRNLIAEGHIAPGEVDERSIADIRPDDLLGFAQCHFFAGIGVWSYALRRAGWPDDRPVWTGSCPCQPFSAAGRGEGFADERHLWPAFHHLIAQRRPPVVFAEQVSSAVRHGWWDLVADDAEGIGYAAAGVIFPSSAVGAPHIRERFYFVLQRQDMHEVRRDQADDRLLLREAFRGRSSNDMQDVRRAPSVAAHDGDVGGRSNGTPEGPAIGLSRGEAVGARLLGGLSSAEAREEPDLSSEGASAEVGCSVRSGPARGSASSADRRGPLRDVRHSLRSDERANSCEPVVRQDQPGEGVCLFEHSGPLPSDELCAWGLGRGCVAGGDEVLVGEAVDAGLGPVQAHGEADGDAERSEGADHSGVGAPHIRDRAYFVAHADRRGGEGRAELRQPDDSVDGSGTDRLAYAAIGRWGEERPHPGRGALGDRTEGVPAGSFAGGGNQRPGPTNGFWRDPDWLHCRDGRWRAVEPGTFPLAHGAPARVGRLRAYGNAINAEAAAAFISASLDMMEHAA